MGARAELRGSRAWSRIKDVSNTHVPGWAHEKYLICVSSERAVRFLQLQPWEGLSFSSRVNSWPLMLDFSVDAGAELELSCQAAL